MTTPTWETMADDELLDRLGLALATEPAPSTRGYADDADAVVVPLVIAPPAPTPSWRRPLAWAAAILLIGAVAGGIATRGDTTEGVGTTDPAVPGTIGGNPEVRAAESSLAALEAALATGEPSTIGLAADTLRATLALLDPAERDRLGERPDELLAQADAALAVETTTTSTSTTTATSTPGTDAVTTPASIDDHGGGDDDPPGDDNSGPGSSGSGSSGSESSGTSGSGSGRSGSDDVIDD